MPGSCTCPQQGPDYPDVTRDWWTPRRCLWIVCLPGRIDVDHYPTHPCSGGCLCRWCRRDRLVVTDTSRLGRARSPCRCCREPDHPGDRPELRRSWGPPLRRGGEPWRYRVHRPDLLDRERQCTQAPTREAAHRPRPRATAASRPSIRSVPRRPRVSGCWSPSTTPCTWCGSTRGPSRSTARTTLRSPKPAPYTASTSAPRTTS